MHRQFCRVHTSPANGRSAAAVAAKFWRSICARKSAAVLGGFFRSSRSIRIALSTCSRLFMNWSNKNASGCWAAMPSAGQYRARKSRRFAVTITVAPPWIAVASTCRSPGSGNVDSCGQTLVSADQGVIDMRFHQCPNPQETFASSDRVAPSVAPRSILHAHVRTSTAETDRPRPDASVCCAAVPGTTRWRRGIRSARGSRSPQTQFLVQRR